MSDATAVNFGAQWYELSPGPTPEDVEKAAKDPAANISFGKPSFQELEGLVELEVSCKQLLNFAEVQASSMREGAKIVFGGFSQGGAVAAYAALSGLVSEELRPQLSGVLVCCSGVPVLHFLAPRMQAACLAAREEVDGPSAQPVSIHLLYGRDDPEVKESFVETSHQLYRRFDFPATLHRFTPCSPTDRFPEDARRSLLPKVLQVLTPRDAC